MIFHFSGDYDSGELGFTEEGEFVWFAPEEISGQELFPSVREVIRYILDPEVGTVFATVGYDEEGKVDRSRTKIQVSGK